ncbi:MAG: hypothetical protein R3C14_33445 [Caldilineaceae bacterium]
MIPYATSKFPPTPILNIALSAPGEGAQTALIPALIDTGSDFTLVPEKWLRDIDAPRSRPARVRGLWRAFHEVTLFLIDIHLDIGALPGVEVVRVKKSDGLFENEEIVLGRNVLNLLILLLEGPTQQTSLLERRPRRF